MGIFLYGMMSLARIPIDMLNSGIFLLLSISALQDYIFIQSHMLSNNSTFSKSAKSLLLPSFFTSLTTVIGFGSLYLSDIVILQRFGMCAAFGAIVEWSLTFLFLPAVCKQFKFFNGIVNKEKARQTDYLKKLTSNNIPRFISIILLFAFISGSYSVIDPNIHEEPFGIYPDDHTFTRGIDKLINSREWSATFDILFTTTNKEKITNVIGTVSKMEGVTKVVSYNDVENFLTKELSPIRRELVNRELSQTQVYERFKNNDISRAIVYIKRNEVSLAAGLKNKIESICNRGQDCYATGNLIAYTEFGEKVPRALVKSFGTSLILVTFVLIILIWLNKGSAYFSTVASSMWGPFACLTLMSLMDIPINYITCMFASIIVGLTGDNAIQYIFASNKDNIDTGVKNMGGASILVFLMTASCSTIFLFGYFKFSKDFGVILILGGLLSLLGDIWILKALNSFRRKQDA